MTKANATKAVSKATAEAAKNDALKALLASMSPEQIAALLPTAAKQEGKASKPAKQATDYGTLVGKLVKVTGGKKHVGETLKCFYVSKGGFRKPSALCEGAEILKAGEMPIFMNPDYLEVVGDMTAADIKRHKDMQEAQRNETLYIAARAVTETEKSIQLAYPTWAKNLWFARPSMISIAGETPDGGKIFEIAAWKVRKECGMDAYNALVAKQDDLEKIVNG